MTLFRITTVVVTMASMLGAYPAMAAPDAAAGAQNQCVKRQGEAGEWRVDQAGKWIRCAKEGGARAGEGSNGLVLSVFGASAAIGVAVAVGGGGSSPASP